jgi:hypothetical protein
MMLNYNIIFRELKRGFLEKEYSIFEVELLVGLLHISLQLETVTDILCLFQK